MHSQTDQMNLRGPKNTHRPYRAEMFTAQAVTNTSIYYFHVAANRAEEVLDHLNERSEYTALDNVKRVEVFEGELFARYDGQLPIHVFKVN